MDCTVIGNRTFSTVEMNVKKKNLDKSIRYHW